MARLPELVRWPHEPYRGLIVDRIEEDYHHDHLRGQRFVMYLPNRTVVAHRPRGATEFRYEEIAHQWCMRVRYGHVSWELLRQY